MHYGLEDNNENDYCYCMEPNKSTALSAPDARLVAAVSDAARAKRVTSRELLGGGDLLIIEHEGREYRLRLTRNGKLIMTA